MHNVIPLVVELAEIIAANVENTALTTYTDPFNIYRDFVDDGIGDFRNKPYRDGFLNFLNVLTEDLNSTIEYPPCKSTFVYRTPHKPTTSCQCCQI